MAEESNKVSTILQCFVDTNLELNEKYPYQSIETPSVRFNETFYIAPEGVSVVVQVSLSSPSAAGNESVDIVFIPREAVLQDVNTAFPINVQFEQGQQTKNIQIEIASDFELETGRNESFQIALVSSINCIPIQPFDVATVFITDTTVFNSISFVENADSELLPNGVETFISTTYNSLSGAIFTLALNNPSIGAGETVNVKIYRIATTIFDGRFSELVTSIPVTFEIGEQTKNVLVSNLPTNVLNSSTILVASIEQPIRVSVNPNGYQYAMLYLPDNSLIITRRYSNLIFKNFYRQKGPTTNGYAEFRSPVYNDIPQTLSTAQNNWLIKFGDVYQDDSSNEENGNAEANYPDFPFYRFGNDAQGNPVDLKLLITNSGEYDIIYNGQIYAAGQEWEIDITGNDFQIQLPSNSNLIEVGEIIPQTGTEAQQRLYADSVYTFKIKLSSPGYENADGDIVYTHGFEFLNSTNNEYTLGTFSLVNYGNSFQSLLNPRYLTSYYTNAATRYNGSACGVAFNQEANIFNVRMLGFILLDSREPITSYGGHEFIALNEYNNTCGGANTNYTSPTWLGVDFEIAEPLNDG